MNVTFSTTYFLLCGTYQKKRCKEAKNQSRKSDQCLQRCALVFLKCYYFEFFWANIHLYGSLRLTQVKKHDIIKCLFLKNDYIIEIMLYSFLAPI